HPRPHGQPLLPYTTLFRSIAMVTIMVRPTPTVIPLNVGEERLDTGFWFVPAVPNNVGVTFPSILKVTTGPGNVLPALSVAVAWTDRKSTRLNSSHLGISYA